MPKKYNLTHLAKQDISEIAKFISKDNVAAAKKVVDEIYKCFSNLSENPKLGHVRDDLTDKPVKFISVRHYMIIYKYDDSSIKIIRVLSSYRDIASII